MAIPSFSVQASLPELAKEFIKSNTSVLTQKTSIELSKLGLNAVEESKNWALVGSAEYSDSTLESASSFALTGTDTKTGSLTFSKSTFWGGEFAFVNSVTSLDVASTSTKTNNFSQALTYSQDIGANFLGRNDKLDLKIAKASYETQKMSGASEIESGLLKFVTAYSTARLNKSLFEMQKRALERAVKREKLVSRRVKDGLRERVDLFSAKTQTLSTKEEVQNSKTSFIISLDSLSQSIHRIVKNSEVDSFKLELNGFSYIPKGELQKNKSIQALKLNIKELQKQVEQDTNNIFPTISLDTSYTTNDYNSQASEAFSNGKLGSDNRELSVAVNLTWSLGNELQKINKATNNAQLKLAQYTTEKSEINLKQTELLFKKRISLINQNLKSVAQRRSLVVKKLNEYNRLYKRGRADLEQVIRAEEDLIQTEVSFARYLSSREALVYGLATLYGTLETELFKGQ